MRYKGFTFWHVVVLLAVVVVLAAILFPVFGRARNDNKGSCYSNLKEIGLGIRMYTMDYDEVYPPVSSRGQGWSDLLMPYTGFISKGSRYWFHCPHVWPASKDKSTDYFYNSRLAGLPVAAVKTFYPVSAGSKEVEAATIMVGDGLANSHSDANLKELSYGWRHNPDSPAFRHYDNSAVYLFADGHTRPLKPEEVANGLPLKGSEKATFETG